MKCENCKQYESAPLWNKCYLTGSECFLTIDNCDLVDNEGNDTGVYDRLLSDYEREMERIQTEVLQEQESDNQIKELEGMALWLRDAVIDEENWELNAVAFGEVICRKLVKCGLLELEDGNYRYARQYHKPTGEWEEVEKSEHGGLSIVSMRCNHCGRYAYLVLPKGTKCVYDYCPWCKADMRGDKE